MQKYSLVEFDKTTCDPEVYEQFYKNMFDGKQFILFGEIEQMPGHCIVIETLTGKPYVGFHTENFRILTEDET